LDRSIGQQARGEDLPESFVVRTPAELRELVIEQRFLDLFGAGAALELSTGKRPVKHEMAYAFGMADGVRGSDCAALGDAQERKVLELCRIHDRLEILHPRFEGNLRGVPIRQSASTRVVTNVRVITRELFDPMAPD